MKTTRSLPMAKGSRLLGLLLVIVLGAITPGRTFAARSAITVSGYEAFPGLPCQIEGKDGTCGVRFYGWFGGNGAVPDGWIAYAGKGNVVVRVNYVGQPGLGSQVTVTGGTWRLADHSTLERGTIISGTVTWPMTDEDLGCGAGVAIVETVLADSTFRRFVGCLHDFDTDGQVAIPPKIWGSFE